MLRKCVCITGLTFALLSTGLAEGDPGASKAPSTYCRFVPERMDDFAWENDLVCFRAYGPSIVKSKGAENNGVDCWLKRVSYPIIDSWYKRGDYHADHGEGNDPYHVGSTRGCGGTAIWKDGKMIGAGPYKEWKIISQSPGKSVFELSYQYDVDGTTLSEVKQITIELGKRLFKSESTFTRDGKPVSMDVAIGITTHNGKAAVTLDPDSGWMSCWETIEGAGLGTGVVVDPRFRSKMQEIRQKTKDASHAVAVVRTDAEGKTVHYAGYGWEKAGDITSAGKWQDYLGEFSKSIGSLGIK